MANNVNAFVPEFYSQKLLRESKEMTDFKNNMTNNEWEGEIKSAVNVVADKWSKSAEVAIVKAGGTIKNS